MVDDRTRGAMVMGVSYPQIYTNSRSHTTPNSEAIKSWFHQHRQSNAALHSLSAT